MEHLLTVWPSVTDKFSNGRHILLLCDYDGTLTSITARPENAYLDEETRQILGKLVNSQRITVGIISGRGIGDVRERVGVEGIIYAGNHGLEINGPDISFVHQTAEETMSIIHTISHLLRREMADIRGVIVEDKRLSLSVHYRQVKESEVETIKLIFERVVNGPQGMGKIAVTTGKKVYEVRPVTGWDKGKAVRFLMKKYGRGGRSNSLVPVFIGDDVSDEDGFRVIEKHGGGISILVNESPTNTSARYYLRSPHEVNLFLQRLASTRGSLS